MIEYYDKNGNPLELLEWAKLMEDLEYRVIRRDIVGSRTISTVWLGLNHNWLGGEPLIFETMVFPDEDMERYTTEEEAIKGHERLKLFTMTRRDNGKNNSLDSMPSGYTSGSIADSRMNKVLVVLPDDWVIEKIRYVQVPTGGHVFVLDMDEVDSPLDNSDSLMNYVSLTLKKDGPTGFRVFDVEID